MEVKIIFRNGFVRDVPNLPAGVRVFIYDYDLDKYNEDSQEPDPHGKPCVATIYSHAQCEYSVIITIKKRKIRIVECPKAVNVNIVEEIKK